MTDIQFGRLQDLPLREAWRHEALQFTPWLAENLDHLSDAIGIPLELTGVEVAVDTFSADILARNPMDDTVVLIANRTTNTWIRLCDTPEINLSLYLSNTNSGCFLRGMRAGDPAVVHDALSPHADAIVAATSAAQWESSDTSHFAVCRLNTTYTDRDSWPEIIAWMGAEHDRFAAVVTQIMKGDMP